MINFSTEFPIDAKSTVEDVMTLACGWVCGSPHTKIPKGALDRLPINDEQSHITENEQVTTAIAKTSEFEIGGLRYFRRENGLEWTSSIVSRRRTQTSASLRTRLTSLRDRQSKRLPHSRKGEERERNNVRSRSRETSVPFVAEVVRPVIYTQRAQSCGPKASQAVAKSVIRRRPIQRGWGPGWGSVARLL